MKVSAKNVMKQKSFHKGIEQLVQEERYPAARATRQASICWIVDWTAPI